MAASRPRLQITDGVMAGIEDHAYSLLTAEVGGMLMGQVDGSTTKIVGYIPALSASAEQTTLTFTHEVWEDILKLAEAQFPEASIVGWYHTHPTFGIFLSEYDLFIQENFFAARGHLALVIDPVQGIYGWFAKNSKGAVTVFEEGPTTRGPKRSIEPLSLNGGGTARKNYVRIGVAGGVSFFLGLALGGGIALSQIPPDLSGALSSSRDQLSALATEYQLLQETNSNLRTDPVLQYTSRPGDTVASLARQFYDREFLGRSLLLSANGLSSLGPVPEGSIILVPSPTRLAVTDLSPGSVTAEESLEEDDQSIGADPREEQVVG